MNATPRYTAFKPKQFLKMKLMGLEQERYKRREGFDRDERHFGTDDALDAEIKRVRELFEEAI